MGKYCYEQAHSDLRKKQEMLTLLSAIQIYQEQHDALPPRLSDLPEAITANIRLSDYEYSPEGIGLPRQLTCLLLARSREYPVAVLAGRLPPEVKYISSIE